MKARVATFLGGIALATAILYSAAAHAQLDLNPFSKYYENVARAAKQNDAGSVRSTIANGASPDQTDEAMRTGMHYAATNGNLQIIAILIKAGAKLDPKEKLGNTPLHFAVDANQVEAAKLLVFAGATVDPENKNGMTPLMVAASRGSVDCVRTLLAKGASVAKTDYTGRDAAGWAVQSHSPAVMQAIKRAQNARGS